MYSPTTRLLTVLEILQAYRKISGSELARRLEVNIRTVRRYIVMLQDMGIPVEAERGPYGAYHLQRGYKLPPLMFTDAEAVALTFALLVMRGLHFPVDVAALESVLAKTERLMPEKLLNQARGLQEAIQFYVSPPPVTLQAAFIALLSLAVQQRKQVRMLYRSWRGEDTEREFDAYGIVFNEGYWYTAGYCHLRRDLRTFRLDRIIKLEALDADFQRPDNFDALQHVLDSLVSMPGTEQVEVLLKTTLEHAQEVISPMLGRLEETEQGIILRRPTTQLEWIAHILLSLDFPVQIIQPIELRELVRQFALRAVQILDNSCGES